MSNIWDNDAQRTVHCDGAALETITASFVLDWATVTGGTSSRARNLELDARNGPVSVRIPSAPGAAHNGRKVRIAVNQDDNSVNNFRGVVFTGGSPMERGSLPVGRAYAMDRTGGHLALEVVNGVVRVTSGASFNEDPPLPSNASLLATLQGWTTGATWIDLGNGEAYAQFNANGSFAPARTVIARALAVGGGGAGGSSHAAGGGAGGRLVRHTALAIPAGAHAITVGAGGTPSGSNAIWSSATAGNGGNTAIGILMIANGGGRGAFGDSGAGERNATQGGSGGGGSGGNSTALKTGSTAIAGASTGGETPDTTGVGFAGGNGSQTGGTYGNGAGGGGGAQVGADGTGANGSGTGGNGGAGISDDVTGVSIGYSGGGGGGGWSVPGGTASHGGGGGASNGNGTAGTANTGGGGGGSAATGATRNGGAGGSGVFILRVRLTAAVGLS